MVIRGPADLEGRKVKRHLWKVSKSVDFCYGHRLLRHRGKCRHLHGHSARVVATVAAEALDEGGMVVDFTQLKEALENFVKEKLDHNMILERGDPLIPHLRELGERFLVVEHPPTAEWLAKMVFDHLKARGYNVLSVELWETETSSARYEEGDSPR